MNNLGIIIIDKTGTVKELTVKKYNEEELYKKCGFTKADGFRKQTEWKKKIEGINYTITVYGKTSGKANYENKYEFPPPIDKHLFFGSCALIGQKLVSNGSRDYVSLNKQLWNKVYEKLMGGFEDLSTTAKEDNEEEDELDHIPDSEKTKTGYLKDGFVVDTDEDDDIESVITSTEENEDDDDTSEDEAEELEILKHNSRSKRKPIHEVPVIDKEEVYVDISTELKEEAFSDDE